MQPRPFGRLFGMIRMRRGCKGIPNVKQFIAIYLKVLFNLELKALDNSNLPLEPLENIGI